tara:strand:+ start:546 stop:692 length:147 start_codon:yes stop_codon:yes gene_type:complete
MIEIIIGVVIFVLVLEIKIVKNYIQSKTRNQKILDNIDRLEKKENNEG